MAKYFGDGFFPLKCLKCGHEFQERIASIESDPKIPCPACSVMTQYRAEEVRATMRNVDKAIDNLKTTFRKFGKS